MAGSRRLPRSICGRARVRAVRWRIELCGARQDFRYEGLRIERTDASLDAVGGEPARIRSVGALICVS